MVGFWEFPAVVGGRLHQKQGLAEKRRGMEWSECEGLVKGSSDDWVVINNGKTKKGTGESKREMGWFGGSLLPCALQVVGRGIRKKDLLMRGDGKKQLTKKYGADFGDADQKLKLIKGFGS